jgi:hypothetical protein
VTANHFDSDRAIDLERFAMVRPSNNIAARDANEVLCSHDLIPRDSPQDRGAVVLKFIEYTHHQREIGTANGGIDQSIKAMIEGPGRLPHEIGQDVARISNTKILVSAPIRLVLAGTRRLVYSHSDFNNVVSLVRGLWFSAGILLSSRSGNAAE